VNAPRKWRTALSRSSEKSSKNKKSGMIIDKRMHVTEWISGRLDWLRWAKANLRLYGSVECLELAASSAAPDVDIVAPYPLSLDMSHDLSSVTVACDTSLHYLLLGRGYPQFNSSLTP
jgi:hypothetical protein